MTQCGTGDSPQNTDPFVFEDEFKYFICKQATNECRTPTSMANLEVGSMILFGSTSGKERSSAFFQLDTVFVVGKIIQYDPSDLATLRRNCGISDLYDQLVVSKVFPNPLKHSISLRLYLGATHEKPVNGMYSFSPARVDEGNCIGFPRVKLKQSKGMHFLTNNLNAAPKLTSSSIDGVRIAWEHVRAESRKQRCIEAVRFFMVEP